MAARRQADAAPKEPGLRPIMTAAKALNPQSIYFGGVTAPVARASCGRRQVGLGDVPSSV